jgi:hypothetical protein
MPKYKNDPLASVSDSKSEAAVFGESAANEGVRGISHAKFSGVVGINDVADPAGAGNGGWFESKQGEGVRGHSYNRNHAGVVGTNNADGICIFGMSDGNGIAIHGQSKANFGVFGESTESEGVRGTSHGPHGGVVGVNDVTDTARAGNGGWFESVQGEGVRGTSKNSNHGGVVAINEASGQGLYAKGNPAGHFEGNVEVTGDIRLVNADCAEDFDIVNTETVQPGTVMVLNANGDLQPSQEAYDKRVVGVVSGAGDHRPGIILDKQGHNTNRKPVALLGKVFCKVDATPGAIEIGDLLTTSSTPGHAMKVLDSTKALGTIIGKALRSLPEGQGLIPVLIALQ